MAVGASAGGLRAIEAFLKHLPENPGLAVVILQHQAPDRESIMSSLLERYTSLPVVKIVDDLCLEPNRLYVRPPDKRLTIREGRFHFGEREQAVPLRIIDNFLLDLADDQEENAACVILSGAGADGSQGLRAINAAGGLVMVQDEDQAEYPGMPRAAVETGLVDYILPAEQMGRKLVDYERQSRKARGEFYASRAEKRLEKDQEKILRTVQSATGHDFTRYKQSTIGRRIRRRMALHQCEQLADYFALLRREPTEVHALFNDLLINVTNFFRDPEAYQVLEKELEELLSQHPVDEQVRLWVPGCATGEEAYSLAILLVETMDRLNRQLPVKIFATDINLSSIRTARNGLYPDSIAGEVSETRLKRFFTRAGNRYRVSGQLRDMVIFSPHNVAGDPPFSNLDLVSCRNLLIYMNQQLQKKVLPLLHYSLKPGGLLFLGTSEDVGEFTDLFAPVHRKCKLFRARPASRNRHQEVFRLLGSGATASQRGIYPEIDKKEQGSQPAAGGEIQTGSIRDLVDKTIIQEFAPPGVVVNGENRILYFHGETGRFLTPPQGEAVFDLLRMARGELGGELEDLLRSARDRKGRSLKKEVRVMLDRRPVQVELSAARIPFSPGGEALLLVTFRVQEAAETPEGEECDGRVAELQRELYATRQDLQATIEELETTNEELQSTNEELQANNEELQSTNEELETSREELQSTNEELETVNSELQNKNEELKEANDDMKNLFEATGICTVIVDRELRIRRFTPAANRIFRLIDSDLGRPITDIASVLLYEEFQQDLETVVEKLDRKEREVRSREGDWFEVRIVPYRSSGNVIAGAVVTFAETTRQKTAEMEAREGGKLAESILETLREPLLVLNDELKVVKANQSFYRTFKGGPEGTEGMHLFELGKGQWDLPDLRRLLLDVIPSDSEINDFSVEGEFPGLGRRELRLNARRIDRGPERPRLILLTFFGSTQG